MKFTFEPQSPTVITVISFVPVDKALFFETFPFEDPVTVVEWNIADWSIGQADPLIQKTDILVVATRDPGEDRDIAETLAHAARKAFLKIFFAPGEVEVGNFTNQVYYDEGEGPLCVQLGQFLGHVVGSDHRGFV